MAIIAALFVDSNGIYFQTPEVDPWDIHRDARKYDGPYPVIAHPPCARWSMLAYLVQKRYGHKVGDDGGCFSSALNAVRRFGGVLEHPAYSKAFYTFGLPRPKFSGGWTRGECGGYSCYVEQGKYGHPARKATWLYAFGTDLPELKWGRIPKGSGGGVVSYLNNRGTAQDKRPRLSKKAASATSEEFRDVLLSLARSVKR